MSEMYSSHSLPTSPEVSQAPPMTVSSGGRMVASERQGVNESRSISHSSGRRPMPRPASSGKQRKLLVPVHLPTVQGKAPHSTRSLCNEPLMGALQLLISHLSSEPKKIALSDYCPRQWLPDVGAGSVCSLPSSTSSTGGPDFLMVEWNRWIRIYLFLSAPP